MTTLHIDDTALQQVRRFNTTLARLPRFKMRNRFTPVLGQALLRLSQLGADRRLARRGIRVERHVATCDGLHVPLRVLRPAGTGPVGAVVLDIHGGGWVIGNARMDDLHNAALVEACRVAVVSVDYRLVRPHLADRSLQEAMDDCLAAARWLLGAGRADFDGLPAFILGESAGAHLAATVLLRLKSTPQLLARIAGAVLYYGVYDLGGSPSVRQAGPATLVLDGPGMVDALRMLTPDCNDEQRRQAPRSPLYGDLAGMPPALMFAGARDPLRDDTLQMAARWRGVANAAAVELHLLPEAPHGFLHFPTPLATSVPARTHAWLGERIAAWNARTGRVPMPVGVADRTGNECADM
ncbi:MULTISPECIES: alpha/beta hydrolase [unclassified Massilia]|uniref:alpha/beta hydrolase n=1 Tax=unclassified Massilia TaxID=2609279 RepID=UPI001782D022|nr:MULTISPECIES: alpha/beta hydrolase fold domain-containing protein [unclassified Massilia]MBD8528582.1 alpha/beta hydrolase fold domain-containing protein [Massilia sp. CFBP 13647]MBD8671795.1 alpha/beta hydrolase fold domain-containing protein [Massilia sp. CFBP 13721]